MLVRLALLVCACLVLDVDSSADIIKNLSQNFAKPFEACKTELGLPESVIQDFANFWKEDVVITNQQVGCAIMCMSSKLDLLDVDMSLHHGKAQEFAKKHGADEALAKQLVDMIHNCGETVKGQSADPCQITLNVANCFKAEIHKLKWAPDMELVVGELLAET